MDISPSSSRTTSTWAPRRQGTLQGDGRRGQVIHTQGQLAHTGAQGGLRVSTRCWRITRKSRSSTRRLATGRSSKVASLWQDLLQRYPNVKGGFFHSDDMALAARTVVEAPVSRIRCKLVGVDGLKNACEAILEDKLLASVINPSGRIHGGAIWAGYLTVSGTDMAEGDIPKFIRTDGGPILKNNAAGYIWLERQHAGLGSAAGGRGAGKAMDQVRRLKTFHRSPADSPDSPPFRGVLALRGVTKRFGGARALDGVDFELLPGEIHGLLGENGAGKSTLMKILSGVHTPDEGEMVLRGAPVKFASPADAKARGIGMIYQELRTIGALSGRRVAKMPLLISSRMMSAGLTPSSSASSLTVMVPGSSIAPRSRGSSDLDARPANAPSRRGGLRGPASAAGAAPTPGHGFLLR